MHYIFFYKSITKQELEFINRIKTKLSQDEISFSKYFIFTEEHESVNLLHPERRGKTKLISQELISSDKITVKKPKYNHVFYGLIYRYELEY